MISLEEARSYVMERVVPLPAVRVPIENALGSVLAEAVVSNEDIPSFPNSAMDGFAVRSADTTAAPVTLDVIGIINAGADGMLNVEAGQAVRIMTGAPMPQGADAVVMLEHTTVGTRTVGKSTASKKNASAGVAVNGVIVNVAASSGQHVRRAGESVAAGEQVFSAGTVVTAGHVGVMAGIGVRDVRVHRRPRVGVLSTGDELFEGDVPLKRGQIRDSNRPALLCLLAENGFESVDLGLVPDDASAIEQVFRGASERCDAVLSSGGVSVGDRDYMQVVLDRIGCMRWMQIAIKPAKPFAFGTFNDDTVDVLNDDTVGTFNDDTVDVQHVLNAPNTPKVLNASSKCKLGGMAIFGLPGNPVSSMVSFELLAKPALRAMAGHSHIDCVPSFELAVLAVSSEEFVPPIMDKTQYVRVKLKSSHSDSFKLKSSKLKSFNSERFSSGDNTSGGGNICDGNMLPQVVPCTGQGSHQLADMAQADGLAVVPAGVQLGRGDVIEMLRLK